MNPYDGKVDPYKYTGNWTIEREDFYKKLQDNEEFWRKLGITCQRLIVAMVEEEFRKDDNKKARS